nr:DegT/DnrJ/EryC1/StrS family aminotransferase [Candidatus Omnitrophota bacterium]
MQIPFVDLKSQYYTLRQEIDAAMHAVIEESAFIEGKYVAAFEQSFAQKYGVRHCITVANGTDALFIVFKCLGIGTGDEVITTASSWISTSQTITQAGARVVFVDIEPRYYTIDVNQIESKITSRTKALVPVHLYGHPAAMDAIQELCRKHHLLLVEDCAQAHFAAYKGARVGTFGFANTFSFYPAKNLGAYGDAGAIVTNDDALARAMRMFSRYGGLEKHQHEIEGINSRTDGLQAAILSVKLQHIDGWNQRRLAHACLYNELLKDIPGVTTPQIRQDSTHVFHVYAVMAKRRDELQQFLSSRGIATAIHYPVALPFLPAYRYLGHGPDDFPVAYQHQLQTLSLPMYPELSREQID